MKKLINDNILNILGFVVVIILVLWQTGYNPFAGSGDIGKIISPSEFVTLKKDKESDGQRIALIGTFSVSNSSLTINLSQPTSIYFSDEKQAYIDHFEIWNGSDENEFSLPTTFTPEDLKIYDNAGNPHSYNELVKISFTMDRVTEAEPEKNPNTGEYSWNYKQLRIDPITEK